MFIDAQVYVYLQIPKRKIRKVVSHLCFKALQLCIREMCLKSFFWFRVSLVVINIISVISKYNTIVFFFFFINLWMNNFFKSVSLILKFRYKSKKNYISFVCRTMTFFATVCAIKGRNGMESKEIESLCARVLKYEKINLYICIIIIVKSEQNART